MKENSSKPNLILFKPIEYLEEKRSSNFLKYPRRPYKERKHDLESKMAEKEAAQNIKHTIINSLGKSLPNNNKSPPLRSAIHKLSQHKKAKDEQEKKEIEEKEIQYIKNEHPSTMTYKLLEGKQLEKVKLKTEDCYKIEVENMPSVKEMQERAKIMAKMLLLYNKDQYPQQRVKDKDNISSGAK